MGGQGARERLGIAATGASLGVTGGSGDEAVAVGETLFHRRVARELGADADLPARDELERRVSNAVVVSVRPDAEVIVSVAAEPGLSPVALQRGLRNANAGGKSAGA
jgi:hypothetical protein